MLEAGFSGRRAGRLWCPRERTLEWSITSHEVSELDDLELAFEAMVHSPNQADASPKIKSTAPCARDMGYQYFSDVLGCDPYSPSM